LAQENPHSPEVEESLGYLAWQENHLREARKHLALAVERGSQNSRMIYDLAELEQAGGATSQAVIDLLQKVIALQPDHNDARIFLAGIETGRGHYGSALAAITPIHTVRPEQAFPFFSVAAYSHANLQDFQEAKSLAAKALRIPRRPGNVYRSSD
jgi:cytochrome c-type biogenesis protein CcmH/NrfG